MEIAELLSWLWRSSWQASVLVLLVLLIQRVFRTRLGSRWHYALWLLVLGRLVIPVMPESSFSIFNYARMDSGVFYPWKTTGTESAAASAAVARASSSKVEVAGFGGNEMTAAPVPAGVVTQKNFVEAWGVKAAGFLWAAVALIVAARLSFSSLRFSRRLNRSEVVTDPDLLDLLARCAHTMGVRRRLDLIETAEVESPALFGFLRPRLLLPLGILQNSSQEDLRYIFLHELAHIRRGDVWVHRLLAILQTIHWFNPVLWIAFQRMRADRELACDELVLSRSGEKENVRYGEAILRLLEAQTRPACVPGLIGIIDSREQVKRRIRSIARFRKGRSWSVWPVVLVAILAFGALTDALSHSVSEKEMRQAMETDLTLLDLSLEYDLLEDETSEFGTWEEVPKGLQIMGGVPFDVGGMIRLFGTIPPPHGTTYRDEVIDIPVGRRFEQLHLLHGTGWTGEEGLLIASIVLHYSDGDAAVLPVIYGQHVRDWWKRDLSLPGEVSDPDSGIAWEKPFEGMGLRFYRSSFVNPEPEKKVVSLDLISEWSEITPAILSITVGDAVPFPEE